MAERGLLADQSSARAKGLASLRALDHKKITFLQSLISVDVDGRVDPTLNSARYTTSIGSKDVYLIMRLNQILKEVHPREYPRLDLMPEFVWRISDKVKPVFWN